MEGAWKWLSEVGCGDGSGSGSCPNAVFITGDVEPAGFCYKIRLLSPRVWCYVLKTM